MSKGYAVFCDADRRFYDAPHRVTAGRAAAGELYAAAHRPAPEGWQRHRSGDWLAYRPLETTLPAQGWKIHVSACLANAESVLERVWDYCVARSTAFKFVPSRYLLHNRNAKYADRGASGKFMTVYPLDDADCERIAGDLAALLDGEPGPYILSDLRWGAGPVHLRYGSFTERNAYDDDGNLCPAIEEPGGRLVPDRRGPAFHLPEWLDLPDFLRPHLDARSAATFEGVPYRVERALHFSNGGGVYAGRDTRTGEEVVLKEARPHAGLAADGADAVQRLERERDALVRLSGVPQTPEVRDHFTVGDHHFLVLEYLPGKPLNTFFARRHPLIEPDPSAETLAEYTDWALRIYGLVEQAVDAVHARGVVFNDLHLFNIMVSEDESSVALLDFEAATSGADGRRQVIANPGFVAPADRRGFAVDRYALACLRLALFLPLTSLLALDRGKAAHLAQIAADHFPVPRAFLDEAVAEITRGTEPAADTGSGGSGRSRSGRGSGGSGTYLPVQPADWPRSRDSMIRALLASATPDREDRYFPGDIAQFATPSGGATFGYGTAGVLHALAETGADRAPDAEEWLLRRMKEPASGTPLGFYDGLTGIGWVLHRLGHTDEALDLAAVAAAHDWRVLGSDLHSGLAGVGLALDSLAAGTGDGGLADAAARCTALLADRAAGRTATPGASRGDGTPRAGLLRGRTGEALFFVRRYERTGDPALLDLAADALRADLDQCVRSVSGALAVNEGWRTMPYLGAGSVGIGMVLDDYLAHRDDARFADARREIVRAAQAKFYAQPGLFRGAAGMVLYLARTTADGPGTGAADLRRQIDALSWTAMPYRDELAFPGEQMMRLSMDLSTGTAGCLLALGSAYGAPGAPHRDEEGHGRTTASLPFLPPLKRRPQNPVP
ncbi:class III lanthionine synthetase LanKC [Streptomyces sp. DSM 42041]|uniref:non-specific serine/threonine protein kinase n=1 Tax=Streptomyces hazeniae TaxID=3075538 RepID=A0ABU2NLH8_9ACTN|nr:class III lanthionine synthetase LanKC [Streptomyces sp. DSM 42041]MDT0377821.1 class III lanthionine synthetase LanKC [Streptomyces sp. DSM 42041]